MNHNDRKTEELIEKILQLRDEGKPFSEILNLLPDDKDEIEAITGIIDVLEAEKRAVPPRELLSQILTQIKNVTESEAERYLYERGERLKGRTSIITIIKNQYTMAKNWKVIVPIGVLALVALVVIVTQLGGKPGQVTGPIPTTEQQQEPSSVAESPAAPVAKPPAATANIDDVVNTLFADSSDEVSQVSKDMDGDVALVGLDSQAISDFGQTYNENDF